MTDALREKLVDAGRVLVSEDQGDYVAGHVTLRLPGGDGRFLMKPAGIGLEEMTPDGIITVDREGERIDGTMPRHNEVFIHSEILRVRSDIAAVVHTHPPNAVAFSSLGRPLLPVGNDGSIFNDGVPVFSETTDLIIDSARGKAVHRHRRPQHRGGGMACIEARTRLPRAAAGRSGRRSQAARGRRRPAAEEPAGQPHRSAYECLQLSRPAMEMPALSSG